ncbi:hypothetical protein EJB05_26401, partial [Eragrostis curvula]
MPAGRVKVHMSSISEVWMLMRKEAQIAELDGHVGSGVYSGIDEQTPKDLDFGWGEGVPDEGCVWVLKVVVREAPGKTRISGNAIQGDLDFGEQEKLVSLGRQWVPFDGIEDLPAAGQPCPAILVVNLLVPEVHVIPVKLVRAPFLSRAQPVDRNAVVLIVVVRLLVAARFPVRLVVVLLLAANRATEVSLPRPRIDLQSLSHRRNGDHAGGRRRARRARSGTGPDPARPVTETTPEPLDFQLPEEQAQEVQEEQPQQDTDPADPVSYNPEPGKPRYISSIFIPDSMGGGGQWDGQLPFGWTAHWETEE